jgi:hypothetical protein
VGIRHLDNKKVAVNLKNSNQPPHKSPPQWQAHFYVTIVLLNFMFMLKAVKKAIVMIFYVSFNVCFFWNASSNKNINLNYVSTSLLEKQTNTNMILSSIKKYTLIYFVLF